MAYIRMPLRLLHAHSNDEGEHGKEQGEKDGQTHAQLGLDLQTKTKQGKAPVEQGMVVYHCAQGHSQHKAHALQTHLPIQHQRPFIGHAVFHQGIVGQGLIRATGHGLCQAADHTV